ncbi:EcoKI restriction-modification system protein HsdS [Gallibacterium anatis UMN179]|uniref:EcoKI restriction-modification system protein HsdS n=1 Tax=Gallibacterium anatis (strain UMN179) TaxID=1005058 RepID=F4HF72_GALAU|nr:restriction endonuclease subunit S [Gallibacterium anatis]AEC16992.1 EcoKI restriction-modification system protein HsdS [Gallibacterium anatis UMN179]
MNYLEKLLQGAPVEWKTLGEVAKLQRGRVISKQYLSENIGDYPVYSSQTANNGEIGTISTFDFDQEAITWTTDGANAGTVFHRLGKFSITNVCGLVNILDLQQLDYKFLFYWLSIEAKKYVYSGMGNPKLMSNQMEKIKIPIPPLSVQKEIARILDAFTAITSELTSELTLRQKQYQHYRDKLLTFGDEVEWKTLGEITSPTKNIQWKNNTQAYRYIDLTSVSRENHCILETTEITALNAPSRAQRLVKKDDVIFATTRPTQLRFALINDIYSGQVVSTGYCVLRAKEEVLPKWIYYCISTIKFKNYVEENQSGSAYPAISDAKVKEFRIPILSIQEQKRIVSVLDKFETLTNSLSDGLPKEIELRQKQYEYYRDLLLNFKQDEASLSPS